MKNIKSLHAGFTLIELLIAMSIGVTIVFLSYQALTAAMNIDERVTAVNQHTNDMSRVWQLIGDDLQHSVARSWTDQFSNAQPAMSGLLGDRLAQSNAISVDTDTYLLRFIRSGEKNFFNQARSNLQLVGYRITRSDDNDLSDDTSVSLWRDHWRPIDSINEPTIKSRRLLDNINSIRFRYLPHDIESINDQAWLTGWPEGTSQNEQLPLAVEVTLDIANMGEITRLFLLAATSTATKN